MPANQLIHEKSPYLLQHAHNPVHWYPWGEEAFRKARERDMPIFLSVGYSTCHWCHVMERESFENEQIAELLNRHFISIKLDREERPDIDRVYMTFVQAATGSGGWPMSVFLAPDPRLLDSGFYAFRRSFDTQHGGFGGAPKFPRSTAHNFLLRYHARTKNAEALEIVLTTLNKMARGGIRDHLGGGFHRYAVDERWLVPHFEKMLYDQAQIAVSYLEAFQIAGDEYHAQVAREILDYVLRDMTDAGGGFYSAEDADSVIDPSRPEVKGEGAYYMWTQAEITTALGQPAADWFCYRYGVEEHGNVRNDPHGEFSGKNILYEAHSAEETAGHFERPVEEVREALEASHGKLLEVRSRRVRPGLDDKILTAWNGLMISAFAKGAQALYEPRYLDAARHAAEFLLARAYDPERAALLRRYREGEAAIAGFLDDYAFFIQGLVDLYETDFDVRWIEAAIQLTGTQLAQFEDQENGGFFSTAAGASELVMRMKDDYDGAEPSGNSVAALNLLRLAQFTGRAAYRESAERTLRAFAGRMADAALAVPQMLVAYAFSIATPKQIVIVGRKDAEDTRRFLREVNRRFLPNKIVLLVDGNRARRFLPGYLPAIESMTQSGGATTAYVCENYACRLPTSNLKQFGELLES